MIEYNKIFEYQWGWTFGIGFQIDKLGIIIVLPFVRLQVNFKQ